MLDKLHLTQEQLSVKVGKSRSHITNILGLLRLPEDVQELVVNKKLSMGHARVLSKLEDEQQIKDMAQKIVDKNIPVRDIEVITNNSEKRVKNNRRKQPSENEYKYVEELLKEKLDTKVKVKDNKIEISFTNVADLNRILDMIDVKE
jgi:ParB family chromosome partitioning protein